MKTSESAAVRTLKTTGTSIEDYGRRNQEFDKAAFKAAHQTAARPATVAAGGPPHGKRIRYEISKVTGADQQLNSANQEIVNTQTQSRLLEKTMTTTTEQQRLAAVRTAEEAELARRQSERQANQQEMNSTLQGIYADRHAAWESKKNDKSNWEMSQRIQQENQELTSRAQQERLAGAQSYKDELNRLREDAVQQNIQGKISDRELERRLNGLTFECYTRDQKMKEESKQTGKYQRTQIDDWQSRKQQERQDLVQPPPVFYTDKELNELQQEANQRQQEVKTHYVENAKTQLNQHFTKQAQQQDARARTLEEERAMHQRMRELEAQEQDLKRRTRSDRQSEMTSTISQLDQQKRAAWEAKKNDKTNKLQTEELNQQVSHMTRTAYEDSLKQKQSYNQDLSHLTAAQRSQLEQERNRARAEEARAKGLTFECYQRDPLMKEAAKETGSFQRSQKEIEAQRKQEERQSLIAPPPSLMTTTQLRELEQEALNQDLEKRSTLKTVMHSQYVETQAERQARIASERAADEAAAAQAASRNAEISRQEKQIKQDTTQSYNQYLGLQLTDAERRKQEEEHYRKYDPNLERLAQEQEDDNEIVVRYQDVNGVLVHDKTYLSRGHR